MVARSGERTVESRPVALLGAGIVALGGLIVLGEAIPLYSVDNFVDQAAFCQHLGAWTDGGSNYTLSDFGLRTMAGQLAYAPFALLRALFRPLIFEVSNLPMAVGAIETTILAVLVWLALTRHGWRTLRAEVHASPIVMMSSVFVRSFGIAVGLSTTNLGTLSRYRVPTHAPVPRRHRPLLAAAVVVPGTGASRTRVVGPTHRHRAAPVTVLRQAGRTP